MLPRKCHTFQDNPDNGKKHIFKCFPTNGTHFVKGIKQNTYIVIYQCSLVNNVNSNVPYIGIDFEIPPIIARTKKSLWWYIDILSKHSQQWQKTSNSIGIDSKILPKALGSKENPYFGTNPHISQIIAWLPKIFSTMAKTTRFLILTHLFVAQATAHCLNIPNNDEK